MENFDMIKVAKFVFRFILHSPGRKEIVGRKSLSSAFKTGQGITGCTYFPAFISFEPE